MDEARLVSLLEEATAHCYDAEDEFWAIFSTLVGRVTYPVACQMGGETVSLLGMDGPTSAPESGVMARIERSGSEETAPLADLTVIEADPDSAAWLAVYAHWMGKKG
ncbi:MAG TPA: hypothetical protein ENN19_03420 [Chloroflexi bacterium]|nr:hypothetical protein [Chloroflexota bacterium]